jgi:hypothetical protein
MYKQNQTLLLLEDLCPVFMRAQDRWRAGASGTDAVRELCSGCTTIWFLGGVRATACIDFSTTTTTPDFLQRLLCYNDNDTMVDPGSSNARYLLISLIFIYALFFLSFFSSSFLYAYIEIVLLIMVNFICVIMFNSVILWIKIMWKLLNFLTIQKPNYRQFSVTGFAAVLKPTTFDGKKS